MNDMHNCPSGSQLYLLSEEGYEKLQQIQTMLMRMARISYHEKDAILAIRRADLYYFFDEISVGICEALESVENENLVSPQSLVRR